ncbi:MAG TPA: tetratricopeptide repeat protein, partial [Polyangiales bacterium]|nr:tetratricopeptide repeat protein [Polyangiales bacterium]
ALLPLLLSVACAASPARPTTPNEVVKFDELRINAKSNGSGGYDFESYDASDLFKQGTELLNAKKCHEAAARYDKLVAEFPDSEYVASALYNAGLCFQALGEFAPSAEHYQRVVQLRPDADEVKDAKFQLAEVLVQLERWDEVLATSDDLLARTDLKAEERLEGMARHAQGLLGAGRLDEAERYAQSALAYFRTRPKDEPIRDEFFAAACNYVLAETFRVREEQTAFPEGLEPQKAVLIRRAELLLQAQREYFNTISFQNLDNLHWAAASGYRIGHMYDELWHAIMSAPVPANLKGAEGEAAYHEELAKLIKPLIRHAIRYFEMTLMFIERTGMNTPWAAKTKEDLARVRALMLEQPEGPGGLPAPATAPAATGTPPTAPATPPPPAAEPVAPAK